MDSIEKNLGDIRRRIRAAEARSARPPESVRLIAVSKRIPAESVARAMRCGQTLFGESYVQEARKKLPQIARADLQSGTASGIEYDDDAQDLHPSALGLELHLVGALQKNKVKRAVGFFELIHSVDRYDLALAISREATRRELSQRILLQINISQEPTKAGVSPLDAPAELERILELDGIEVCGLMCIGTWHPPDRPKSVREAEFRQMAALCAELRERTGCGLPELSMGMSDDFELAIENGATMVRIGTALFGARA